MMKLVWTREKVLAGLRQYIEDHPDGDLPGVSKDYLVARAGNKAYPHSISVLRYFGAFLTAWVAAGADKSRVPRAFAYWTEAEMDYLLENANQLTLEVIGAHLGRSAASCENKMRRAGVAARECGEYVNAEQVAVLYQCSLRRIMRLIQKGELPARKAHTGRWQIDPEVAEKFKAQLQAPRRSHRNQPPNIGHKSRVKYDDPWKVKKTA